MLMFEVNVSFVHHGSQLDDLRLKGFILSHISFAPTDPEVETTLDNSFNFTLGLQIVLDGSCTSFTVEFRIVTKFTKFEVTLVNRQEKNAQKSQVNLRKENVCLYML